jgi:SRSO17 transposase
MNDEPVSVTDLADLYPRLKRFSRHFEDCFSRRSTHGHLLTYMAGQHSALPRKSVEPMALAADVPPRTLQEFLGLSRWNHERLRQRVLERVLKRHAAPTAIALIDETSFAKKGCKTAGVQHQYCGATGKTDNCVVAVYLGYATEHFHALVDCDLFLPEETWAENPERREEAGIPPDLKFRTKGQIALDLLRRATAAGASFKYLTADELYGSSSEFRAGVAELGIGYVVEVNPTTSGWARKPHFEIPKSKRGAPPCTRERRTRNTPASRRVDRVWPRGGPAWRTYHVKETEKGPVVWEARAARFWPSRRDCVLPECWLLVARHVLTGEVKYFLSNAPVDAPLETLLHVAFCRAEVEQLFEASKGEIGLDHFEVRHYLPLTRHLVVSLASLLFLEEETQRLRKKTAGGACARSERRPNRSLTAPTAANSVCANSNG